MTAFCNGDKSKFRFAPELGGAVYNPGTSSGDSGDSNEIKWNYDVNMKKKWER